MKIDQTISDELARRGFHVSGSATRKAVFAFEKNEISTRIFNYFKSHGYMRVLFQTIYEQIPLTVDEASIFLIHDEKIKEVIPHSPSRNFYCRNCNEILTSYNPFMNRKPWRKIACPKCHVIDSLRECREEDDWNLTDIQIKAYLDELTLAGILSIKVIGICRNCSRTRDINTIPFNNIDSMDNYTLRRYLINLYCEKCYRLLYIIPVYTVDQLIDQFFGNTGIWLEWYVKNLIKECDTSIHLEQGIRIYDSQVGFEADVLVLKNGEIYCFECKAFNPLKKVSYNDVADIIRMQDLVDRLFLVTTGNLKERAQTILTKQSVEIIAGLSIEELGKLLR